MSLRGPVPTPTTEARRAEFTGGWMGWDGMGWDGMGYQKCPSISFILCEQGSQNSHLGVPVSPPRQKKIVTFFHEKIVTSNFEVEICNL